MRDDIGSNECLIYAVFTCCTLALGISCLDKFTLDLSSKRLLAAACAFIYLIIPLLLLVVRTISSKVNINSFVLAHFVLCIISLVMFLYLLIFF